MSVCVSGIFNTVIYIILDTRVCAAFHYLVTRAMFWFYRFSYCSVYIEIVTCFADGSPVIKSFIDNGFDEVLRKMVEMN